MSDHSPHTIVPAFAPVPRQKDRSNGWKPEVQRAFIEALAETGSVRSAAHAVNPSGRTSSAARPGRSTQVAVRTVSRSP